MKLNGLVVDDGSWWLLMVFDLALFATPIDQIVNQFIFKLADINIAS